MIEVIGKADYWGDRRRVRYLDETRLTPAICIVDEREEGGEWEWIETHRVELQPATAEALHELSVARGWIS